MYLLKRSDFLYQYIATITACLCIVSTGLHYGWPSPALPVLLSPDSPIPITNEQGSLVATIQEFGGVFGAVFVAFIVDKIGRKNTILLSAPVFFVGWMLIAFTESLTILFVARFAAGVVNGMIYTAVPMYLGEISDPSIRGFLGSILQISFVFGLLLYNVLGSLVSLNVATYVAAGIPLLQLVTFTFMPESPYYLILKKKKEAAKMSLEKFNNNRNMVKTFEEIEGFIENDKDKNDKCFLDLIIDKTNRKATLIIFGLRFFQQATGITAMNFYIKAVFTDLDIGISASMVSIVYFLLEFIMCFLGSFFIDRAGRKPLMMISFIGTALTNAILSVYFYYSTTVDLSNSNMKYISVVAIFCYVIIYNAGLASTPMVLLSEMFNTKIKAVAVCFADIHFSFLIILVSVFFQYTKDNVAIYIPFCVFSLLSFLGTLYVHKFVPETKGMTLEEIQDELKGEKKAIEA